MDNLAKEQYTPKQLAYRLRQFAYHESPQFRDGVIDSMHLDRIFDLPFDIRTGVDHEEDDITDSMRIAIGFQALRGTGVYGSDYYHFSVHCEATRPIESTELQLSADEWQAASDDYEVADDELVDEVELPNAVRAKIDSMGIYCTQYIESDYTLATSNHKLQLIEQYGYTIADDRYGVAERDDFYDTNGIGYQEADIDTPTTTQSVMTIDEFMRFNEVVADMRQDVEQTGDVMSYGDKQREMLFILNCLRNRTIPLD